MGSTIVKPDDVKERPITSLCDEFINRDDSKYGAELLHSAIRHDRLDYMEPLLKKVDPNALSGGNTPLYTAIEELSKKKVCDYRYSHPKASTIQVVPELYMYEENSAYVDLLLKSGANPFLVNSDGKNVIPLIYGHNQNSIDKVKAFIMNSDNETALRLGKEHRDCKFTGDTWKLRLMKEEGKER